MVQLPARRHPRRIHAVSDVPRSRLPWALVAAGLLLAALATPLLRRWLFGVSPLDVTAFAAAAGVFLLIALLASALPARRAAAADPLLSLRTD